MMNFTELFSINAKLIEFVDIPVNNEDILAFICPFLIENNKNEEIISEVGKRMKAFLEVLNNQYVKTNNAKDGILFLSHLHEPNEYHLGYSSINKGKAVALSKATDIFNSLRANKSTKQASSITNEAHNVLLLVDGIGQDIMSDIISNVCRDIFAKFTKNICDKYSIPTREVIIEYYNDDSNKWLFIKVELPFNNSHIILVPNKVVSIKRSYSNLYNWFIASKYISEELINSRNSYPKLIHFMKDGTKKAIIKEIYRQYKKPKSDLIDFVLKYQNSLDEFIKYAKIHYPELNIDHLKEK